MTVANLEWFIAKKKPIIYTKAYIELYNQKNCEQIHKIHKIAELKKQRNLTTKYYHNFGIYCIVKISLILHSAYVVSKNQERIMFYINNYIV